MVTSRSWSSRLPAALVFLVAVPVATEAPIKPNDLVGTWDWVARKNLLTNAIDSVRESRLIWLQFTALHWMQIEMHNDRKVVPEAEFAKLSRSEQVKANYAMIWDDEGNIQFAAKAGTYRLDGNVLYFNRVMGLYPISVGLQEMFTIAHLDRNTMIMRTTPIDGVVWERTFRRLE